MYLAQCVFSSLTAKNRQNNVKTAAKLRSFDASADCSLFRLPQHVWHRCKACDLSYISKTISYWLNAKIFRLMYAKEVMFEGNQVVVKHLFLLAKSDLGHDIIIQFE